MKGNIFTSQLEGKKIPFIWEWQRERPTPG